MFFLQLLGRLYRPILLQNMVRNSVYDKTKEEKLTIVLTLEVYIFRHGPNSFLLHLQQPFLCQ